eukprot:545958-Amphidinium_carterae.1
MVMGGTMDARILPVAYNRAGERERLWSSVSEAYQVARLDHLGLSGPRTAEWCVRFLQRQQLHPSDWHTAWQTRLKLHPTDWGVAVHELCLKAIALAGCVDQLDLPNVSTVEHLFRQVQMVEYYTTRSSRRRPRTKPSRTRNTPDFPHTGSTCSWAPPGQDQKS